MKLIELIKRGNLKKALDILDENAKGHDADFSKDIVILKSRLARYTKKKIHKTEANNTLEIEFNQLFESIYDLTQEFEHQYGEIEFPELEINDEELNSPLSEEKKNETHADIEKATIPKWFIYLNRIGLLIVIMVISYLGWLFYQLPPLSEINFFNINNSKPNAKKIISDTIKHIQQVGFDKSDRQLHIVIDILDQKFTWQKNEIITGQYIYDGRVIDLWDYFKDQNYIDKMNESVEIVCLGNASFEESLAVPIERRKSEEETRALIRARNLRDIVKSILKNTETPIYILNLGKHKFEKPPSSNMQRSIVILRILEKENGVNVNEALYNALTNSIEMPFNVTDFSLIKKDSVELLIK